MTLNLRILRPPSYLTADDQDRNLAPGVFKLLDVTSQAWMAVETEEGEELLVPKEGYGFASTPVLPFGTLLNQVRCDSPQNLLACVATRGDGLPVSYSWNAGRKILYLVEAMQAGLPVTSSLELSRRFPEFAHLPITEEERAAEKTGGPIWWRHFPYGGARYGTDGVREVVQAISVYSQFEDHRIIGPAVDRTLELAAAA